MLVFAELRGASRGVHIEVIGGSVLMALGAGAVTVSFAGEKEHPSWQGAAERECRRYKLDQYFVLARMEGREVTSQPRRTWVDWLLAGVSTGIIAVFGAMAEFPKAGTNWIAFCLLIAALLFLLAISGVSLWRATKFT
jgi:hypothetical protein